jgi:hypothetical protein
MIPPPQLGDEASGSGRLARTNRLAQLAASMLLHNPIDLDETKDLV